MDLGQINTAGSGKALELAVVMLVLGKGGSGHGGEASGQHEAA